MKDSNFWHIFEQLMVLYSFLRINQPGAWKQFLFFKYGIGIGNQSNTVYKMFFFPTWTESARWTEFAEHLWTMSGHGTQTQAQRVVNTMRIQDERFKISNWYNILRPLFRVLRITLKILFQCRKTLMKRKMFKYIGYHATILFHV